MRATGIVVWLGLLGALALGFASDGESLIGWAFVLSAFMAVITYLGLRGSDRELVRPRLLRVLLVPLLLATFATTAGAGSTMALGGIDHFSGLVVVGVVNLVLAIATWRVMLSPNAARSAGLGLVAIVIQLFAFVGDAMINLHVRGHENALMFTVFAALVAMATGGLASLAAIACFGPHRVDDPLPQAQLIK